MNAPFRADDYAEAVLGNTWRGGPSGVVNPLNGLGVPGADRTTSNRLGLLSFRTDFDLTRLYLANGLAARIVDAPADDALARGFEIEGDDDDNAIENECDRLDMRFRVGDALRWARLYGGAAIVMIIDDGRLLGEPLNTTGIRRILELKVFDASQITAAPGSIYDDPMLGNFGMPSVYQLVSPLGGISFFCHETRMLFFSGDPVPAAVARMRHNGLLWRGRSALDGCYDDVLRYTAGLQWAERMLERKQQAVYSMQGLADMILNGLQDVVAQRVNAVDIVRSLLNTVVIDSGSGAGQNATAGDKYEVRDLNLAGVREQIEQFQQSICADTGFPATVLFGRSPAGHNATGESDMESYYRLVGHIQHSDAAPAIKRTIELILLQKDFDGTLPERWKVKFNPLWVPSEKDQAQAALFRGQGAVAEAQAAQIYMDSGVMTNVETRDDLIAQGMYGVEGDIDPAELENMLPDPPVIVQPALPPKAPGAPPQA